VRYDRIIEEARILVETRAARGFGDRARRAAVFALFPYPRRLRLMRGPLRLAHGLRLTGTWVTKRLPATPRALARLAPPVRPRVPLPALVAARPGGRPGPARARVGLLSGCVQSVFFGHVSAATVNVLSLEGVEVVVPGGQGCCGALAQHTGRARQAARQARRTVKAFSAAGVDAIITDVAGCGSVMKEYADLLADDPKWSDRAASVAGKVRDVTEFLAELGPPVAPRHPLELTVAYHDACHLSHGQGVRSQPRAVLASIPGLRVVAPTDADVCCGSAGVYNLLEPEPAAELGARKAAALRATGADVVVAGNPGCLLQIAASMRADGGPVLPTRHTIELLDASLRGVSPLA
jgi:glycolate oxidase iron-sulfur subunit